LRNCVAEPVGSGRHPLVSSSCEMRLICGTCCRRNRDEDERARETELCFSCRDPLLCSLDSSGISKPVSGGFFWFLRFRQRLSVEGERGLQRNESERRWCGRRRSSSVRGEEKQKQPVFVAMDFAVVFVVTLLAAACFLASVDAERAAAEKEERSSILGYAPEDLSSESRMLRLFEKWQQQHGKKDYGGVVTEKERRFLIFKENLQYVDAHGKKNSTYWLGLNKFADLSNQEFRAKYTGTKIDRNRRLKKNHQKEQRKSSGFRYADVEAPDSIDWREKGAVAAVKDQGSCGNHLPQFSLIDLLLRHSLSPLSSAFFADLFTEQAIPIHRSVLQ